MILTEQQVLEFKEILDFLDIRLVGVNRPISELSSLQDNLGSSPVRLYSRLDLREKEMNVGSMKQELAKSRKNYHVIAIEALNAKYANLAADPKVDILRINRNAQIKVYNKKFGRRLVENSTLVELDLTVLRERGNIRNMLRILSAIESQDIHYLLHVETKRENDLLPYRGLQSFGRVLGLHNSQTNEINLIQRIERNIKKIEGKIPFEGVELDGSED